MKDIDEENIARLRKRVEETSHMTFVTPKDFDQLVKIIYERTGSRISATTIKRIWGYINETSSSRRSTLDVLAKYCGWQSYGDFVKGERPDAESGFIDVSVLIAESDLAPDDVLRIMWQPSRMCEVVYLGDNRWKVLRSEGTRLAPGDTFKCSTIMSGEPLYLDDLIHNGRPGGLYVCGRRHGVRFTFFNNP